MMNPDMMKFAAEQMQRMSPEELARIQQLAASMDPSVMASAARSMQGMKAEDLQRASEQMKQFSPGQLTSMGAAVQNPNDLQRNAAMLEQQLTARRQYELRAAEKLKAEGNKLISASKHGDASQNYLKAKSNLEGHDSAEARSLRISCSLNLLICYLRSGKNEDAVREASEVLRADASNLKALYRRGQAYKAMGKLQLALTDLRKASQIDPEDETVRDAAEQVKEALSKLRAGDDASSAGPTVEEPDDEESTGSEPSTTAGPSGPLPGMPPGFPADSDAVKRSLAMMKGMDPEMLKNMHKMMAQMSPEVIASMTPGITPEMARETQERLKSVSPEDFQRQAELAAKMAEMQAPAAPLRKTTTGPSSTASPSDKETAASSKAAEPAKKVIRIDHQRKPGASKANGKSKAEDGAVESDTEVEEIQTAGAARAAPAVPTPDFQAPNVTPEMLATAQERMKDPNAMKAVNDMMSSMSPEAMAAMSSSMGMNISPEMAKMALESMKNTKPGDMERMTAAMAANGGASTSGSPFPGFDPSAMGDLKEKMKDPQMMKMASEIMKNLSPEMLQSMSAQAGIKMTPDQAEKAAQAMKGLSDKDIERMMFWADRMQQLNTRAKAARDWLVARPVLLMAIVFLIIAVLLRWLGFV